MFFFFHRPSLKYCICGLRIVAVVRLINMYMYSWRAPFLLSSPWKGTRTTPDNNFSPFCAVQFYSVVLQPSNSPWGRCLNMSDTLAVKILFCCTHMKSPFLSLHIRKRFIFRSSYNCSMIFFIKFEHLDVLECHATWIVSLKHVLKSCTKFAPFQGVSPMRSSVRGPLY